MEGEQYVVAEGPLDTVPIWLRQGAAVALTEAAQHTTTANWKTLQWHVYAAKNVLGQLYEDAGDGYGPSRYTTVNGSLSAGRFELQRSTEGALKLAREVERLRIYGLESVARVEGALDASYEDGLLEVRAAADWHKLEIFL